MNGIYQTNSAEETEKIGEALATFLKKNEARSRTVAFRGEMGVGKTAFTRGFGRPLGIHTVKSPTYTVVNEYRGTGGSIFHFDMYRIADEDELYAIGFEDYLRRDGFLLIEWSENVEGALPEDTVTVTIRRTDEGDGRTVEISGL